MPAICKLHNGATILFLLKMWAVIGASNRVPPKLICYLQPVAFIPRVLLNMEQIKRLILNNHFTMNTLWSLHLHLAIIIQSSCNGSVDSFTFMSASAKNYRHVYLLVSKTRTATARLFLSWNKTAKEIIQFTLTSSSFPIVRRTRPVVAAEVNGVWTSKRGI